LLIFPALVGLLLLIYSWYISYPVSIKNVNDSIFNHISPLYWISLPLLLTSMLLIALTTKNDYLKWIMTFGIIIVMYSSLFFYFMLPTSDSQYFRGLNEFLKQTQTLDANLSGKAYFQWPLFFVFTYIGTSITGLHLVNFEFLCYVVIAFLMASSMFIYSSRLFRTGGFLLAIAFYIAMFYYLNFQFAPFSIAFGILFLIIALDSGNRNIGSIIITIVLFAGMALMHEYVPLFFILYLFARFLISRDRHYEFLLLISSVVYFVVETTLARGGFFTSFVTATRLPTDLPITVSSTLKPVRVPIDVIAQFFSTTTLIMIVGLCVTGFLFLLAKRKIRRIDVAILFAGAAWTSSGVFLYTLGPRAIPLAFLPFALGIPFIFQTRFRKLLIAAFLILLVIFTSIPIHLSFYNDTIQYQTMGSYTADNFLINHYNWAKPPLAFAEYFESQYLGNKMSNLARVSQDTEIINKSDIIVYDIALQNELKGHFDIQNSLNVEKMDVIYDSSISKLILRSYNFTSP
jgi:hypothetical protein